MSSYEVVQKVIALGAYTFIVWSHSFIISNGWYTGKFLSKRCWNT